VFHKRPPGGKVKDTCWVCSTPVYETDGAILYLGLWVHTDCYKEDISPSPERNGESEEPAR
jgi:hypothetical protein